MKKLFTIFVTTLVTVTSYAQIYQYDVNCDGVVDISDVLSVVDNILGKPCPGYNHTPFLDCPDDNHPHVIDLGLGVKWACCNVGATTPEEYGTYYSWGETKEKTSYTEENYQYGYVDSNGLRHLKSTGNISGTSDDIAYIKWGSSWRLPTSDELKELESNCCCEITTVNDVDGIKVTGPNGGSIFLPFAGTYRGSSILGQCNEGHYWSGTPKGYYGSIGYYLYFSDSEEMVRLHSYPYDGRTVRPVFAENLSYTLTVSTDEVELEEGYDSTIKINSGSGSYEISCSNPEIVAATLCGVRISLKGITAGTTEVTVKDMASGMEKIVQVTVSAIQLCPDDNHPHLIDMNDGGKWACCNVGANSPEQYGGYYAWAETNDKSSYSWNSYQYEQADLDGFIDNDGHWKGLGDISGTSNDVARVKWGDAWRMPTSEEMSNLISFCSYKIITIKGTKGLMFTSTEGNRLFLPFAGYREGGNWETEEELNEDDKENTDSELYLRGSAACYWSGTPSDLNFVQNYGEWSVPYPYWCADNLFYTEYEEGNEEVGEKESPSFFEWINRCDGLSVRPVEATPLPYHLSLSNNNIGLFTGQNTTLHVTEGSGNYEVTCINPSIMSATMSGPIINLTGWASGTAVLTVKDTSTSKTQSINVFLADLPTCPDEQHPHAIDLGLPSGIKWACCDVGAISPEELGGSYAWGEIDEKSTYDWENYQHSYLDSDGKWHGKDLGDISGTEYDVAYVRWGAPWRMPNIEEVEELVSNCTQDNLIIKDKRFKKLTGPNGNIILMSMEHDIDDYDWGTGCFYWSSTPHQSDDEYAYGLFSLWPWVDFYYNHNPWLEEWRMENFFDRAKNLSVRPVSE